MKKPDTPLCDGCKIACKSPHSLCYGVLFFDKLIFHYFFKKSYLVGGSLVTNPESEKLFEARAVATVKLLVLCPSGLQL